MITVIVCLFFLALLVLLRIFYENHTFVVTRYDVDSGTNGTGDDWKIVFLSDLHNQEYEKAMKNCSAQYVTRSRI